MQLKLKFLSYIRIKLSEKCQEILKWIIPQNLTLIISCNIFFVKSHELKYSSYNISFAFLTTCVIRYHIFSTLSFLMNSNATTCLPIILNLVLHKFFMQWQLKIWRDLVIYLVFIENIGIFTLNSAIRSRLLAVEGKGKFSWKI